MTLQGNYEEKLARQQLGAKIDSIGELISPHAA
jgi:hypothetical protein